MSQQNRRWSPSSTLAENVEWGLGLPLAPVHQGHEKACGGTAKKFPPRVFPPSRRRTQSFRERASSNDDSSTVRGGEKVFRSRLAEPSHSLWRSAGVFRQRTRRDPPAWLRANSRLDTAMRITCYRCFWPQPLCWCTSLTPMPTRSKFVFLMHPKEWKQEKAATGRLTHLCLAHSEIHCGIAFDTHEEVQTLIQDPRNFPVLLYPGREAVNLSGGSEVLGAFRELVANRQLVVFLLDATWALGRKMLRLSPSLQRLPRIMFTPDGPSRFVIKQQPHAGCLSTLEATHELLLALERAQLDTYANPTQLLDVFDRMQRFQLQCAADPSRGGYRRSAYKAPSARVPVHGRSGTRRTRVFQAPDVARPRPSS